MSADFAQSADALTGPALHDAKRVLRDQVIAARDALDPQDRAAASHAIAERVGALPSFRDARCILLTLPFRSEWDTRPLFAAALARGATVALPRVNSETRMLDLHGVTDIATDTAPGYRGIPEPRDHVAAHRHPVDRLGAGPGRRIRCRKAVALVMAAAFTTDCLRC